MRRPCSLLWSRRSSRMDSFITGWNAITRKPECASRRFANSTRIIPTHLTRWLQSRGGKDVGDDTRALFAQAVDLNPQDVFLLADAGFNLTCMRDGPGARQFVDRALNLSPGNPGLLTLKAGTWFLDGNVAEAQKTLDQAQPEAGDTQTLGAITNCAILGRKYDRALGS